MKKLTANAKIQIQQTPEIVFESIVNPSLMSNYFIKESNARLNANTPVEWSFPEFPESFPVHVKRVIQNEYISFDWSGVKIINW